MTCQTLILQKVLSICIYFARILTRCNYVFSVSSIKTEGALNERRSCLSKNNRKTHFEPNKCQYTQTIEIFNTFFLYNYIVRKCFIIIFPIKNSRNRVNYSKNYDTYFSRNRIETIVLNNSYALKKYMFFVNIWRKNKSMYILFICISNLLFRRLECAINAYCAFNCYSYYRNILLF